MVGLDTLNIASGKGFMVFYFYDTHKHTSMLKPLGDDLLLILEVNFENFIESFPRLAYFRSHRH